MTRLGRWVTAATVAVLLGGTGLAVYAGQASLGGTAAVAGFLPRPDHIVVVVLENKRYDSVIGHRKAPWVSLLARRWANMTQFHAETHPSQPNYLALFSGSRHGVIDNKCPHDLGAQPNLGRQLLDAGHTFAGYSEDLPHTGFKGCASNGYVRRHNPWVNFSNIPATANRPYTDFPKDYRRLPTVSFVIPNLCHDMHDCPKKQADAWLKSQFDPYVRWAAAHNSMFVLTFDEDNGTDNNHIPTLIAGAGVKPGQYVTRLDHYDLLRTIQDMYGLKPSGNAAKRNVLGGVWATQ